MSIFLVIAQFSCIAVLLFGGDWDLPWWSWAIFLLGWTVFLWALWSLGARNFTVMPEPRQDAELRVDGIYRYVRHPMYSAVMLCGLGLALGGPSVARWCALLICVPVLVVKVGREEQALTARYPDYPQRMRGVARLFPGLW